MRFKKQMRYKIDNNAFRRIGVNLAAELENRSQYLRKFAEIDRDRIILEYIVNFTLANLYFSK